MHGSSENVSTTIRKRTQTHWLWTPRNHSIVTRVTPPFTSDPQDVTAGVYWINTSRPLAEKILQRNSADSPRWREYVFQRYVDIILREAIYLLGKEEPTLTPDDISRKVDDVTTKIHDQAAQDLDRFLFDEKFST